MIKIKVVMLQLYVFQLFKYDLFQILFVLFTRLKYKIK